MLKKRWVKVSVILMVLAIMTSSVAVYAESYCNVYVYGARYTVVADGQSEHSGNFVTVTVTNIYKADGSESEYSKVRGDVVDENGNQISVNTDELIELYTARNIILSQVYARGSKMKLRMKGNKSNLDCIVTFAASIS